MKAYDWLVFCNAKKPAPKPQTPIDEQEHSEKEGRFEAAQVLQALKHVTAKYQDKWR